MFYDLYCILGVSQPYVSRYLKGDFTVMSERSCRSIKKWYLAYRKNPEAIGNDFLSTFLLLLNLFVILSFEDLDGFKYNENEQSLGSHLTYDRLFWCRPIPDTSTENEK